MSFHHALIDMEFGRFLRFCYANKKLVAQSHHMVSGTLAQLKYLVIYMNVKQGSGPDRG